MPRTHPKQIKSERVFISKLSDNTVVQPELIITGLYTLHVFTHYFLLTAFKCLFWLFIVLYFLYLWQHFDSLNTQNLHCWLVEIKTIILILKTRKCVCVRVCMPAHVCTVCGWVEQNQQGPSPHVFNRQNSNAVPLRTRQRTSNCTNRRDSSMSTFM